MRIMRVYGDDCTGPWIYDMCDGLVMYGLYKDRWALGVQCAARIVEILASYYSTFSQQIQYFVSFAIGENTTAVCPR